MSHVGRSTTIVADSTAAEGAYCAFPFTYNGDTYNECKREYDWIHGLEWCYTTVGATYTDGDASEPTWGKCVTSTTVGLDSTATEGAHCIFPFTFNDVTYNECTALGRYTEWCYTSSYTGGDPTGWFNGVTGVAGGDWGYCVCDLAADGGRRRAQETPETPATPEIRETAGSFLEV